MDREFDFDDIGKKTPYRTPEHFFEDMQRRVMERVCDGQQRKRRLRRMLSVAVAAAAILVGVLAGSALFADGRCARGNFGHAGCG